VTVLSGGRVGGPSTILITLITTVKMMSGGWAYRAKADHIASWQVESCYLSICYVLLVGARQQPSRRWQAFLVVSVPVRQAPHLTVTVVALWSSTCD
jgi:hypothetical protein